MSWLPKRSIVVPVDFTADSKHAIDLALSMLDDRTGLHAVHVLYPLDVVSPGIEFAPTDESDREEATRVFAKKFMVESGYDDLELIIRMGDPGTEIARYADDVKADLIIIPSHGRHGWKHFFLGSVTEHVIQHAHCEVLVLRKSDAQ
jgi:nucleotide-binding universal stress UspA family protein